MRKRRELILAAMLAAAMVAGCGQQTQPAGVETTAEASTPAESTNEASSPEAENNVSEEAETAEAGAKQDETEAGAKQDGKEGTGGKETAAPSETLKQAFADHDNSAEAVYQLNSLAKQRERSGWSSNLTAEEEEAVIESMNANFKDAVLKMAWENLDSAEIWDYEELALREMAKKDIIPKEKMDRYLLARALYADNLAAKIMREMEPVIGKYLEENPGLIANMNNDAADGIAYASVAGSAMAKTGMAMNNFMAAPAAEVAEEDGALYEPVEMPEPIVEPELPEVEPDSFNTAEYSEIRENPFKSVQASPLSTFSIDVDTAGYTKVKYDILDGYEINKDEVKIEELMNYFNFDYTADRVKDEPFIVSTEYTICPWNRDHQLVRIGIKADDMQEKPDTNFVLVTDVSGSMMIINKLPLALSAYADMLENFDEKDTISLIYYASGNGIVLENVSCGDRDKIYEGLAKTLFSAGGGTNGALGLNTAYEMAEKSFIENGVNRVLIATDGDFNIGRTSEGDLKDIVEEGRKKGVYLTILGYGSENLKDNKMEVMAENGNGNYHYIGDMADAEKALVQESASTLIPMADDVKIQVEFNPNLVKEYRLIGYESRILQAEDFNNDKVDAGEVGAGKSVTALYEIVPAGAEGQTDTAELKYSKTTDAGNDSDLLNVAVRYKEVNSGKTGAASQLIEKAVRAEDFRDLPGDNTALAISLAEFGMVLRESEYRGTASLESAESIARAVAEDTDSDLVRSYADLIGTLRKQSDEEKK